MFTCWHFYFHLPTSNSRFEAHLTYPLNPHPSWILTVGSNFSLLCTHTIRPCLFPRLSPFKLFWMSPKLSAGSFPFFQQMRGWQRSTFRAFILKIQQTTEIDVSVGLSVERPCTSKTSFCNDCPPKTRYSSQPVVWSFLCTCPISSVAPLVPCCINSSFSNSLSFYLVSVRK